MCFGFFWCVCVTPLIAINSSTRRLRYWVERVLVVFIFQETCKEYITLDGFRYTHTRPFSGKARALHQSKHLASAHDIGQSSPFYNPGGREREKIPVDFSFSFPYSKGKKSPTHTHVNQNILLKKKRVKRHESFSSSVLYGRKNNGNLANLRVEGNGRLLSHELSSSHKIAL